MALLVKDVITLLFPNYNYYDYYHYYYYLYSYFHFYIFLNRKRSTEEFAWTKENLYDLLYKLIHLFLEFRTI
jgi:hypothetical protein